jgi:fructokinase
MKKVICFGEALIDFLNCGQHPDGRVNIPHFHQYPGGAPANAAVAVAKLGGQARFVGQVGKDAFGDFLEVALQTYGVDTEFLLKHHSANTALAFVMLDENGERSFSFYREQSADVIFEPNQLNESMFEGAGILHFCSNTLTTPLIALTTEACINLAKRRNIGVSFDVNLRHNLWNQGKANRTLINQLVKQADVLKFSREEIDYLAENEVDLYVQDCISAGCKLLVITDGADDIHFYTPQFSGYITAPIVQVVDTTAGGDAFSGGLLFQLSMLEDLNTLDAHKTRSIVQFAAACGAHVVTKPGAFPALPEFADVSPFFPEFLAGN